MKSRTRKRTKDGAFLMGVAESIGSTLGTIAAKANAAQRALTHSPFAHTVEREGKKLARKSKSTARKTGKAVANLKKSKIAAAARRGLRRATSSGRLAARRGASRARSRRARARR